MFYQMIFHGRHIYFQIVYFNYVLSDIDGNHFLIAFGYFFAVVPIWAGPHSYYLSIFMTLREALFEEPLPEFITCTIFLCLRNFTIFILISVQQMSFILWKSLRIEKICQITYFYYQKIHRYKYEGRSKGKASHLIFK